MRIVLDTNLLMSAIFFDGLPERLIYLVLSDRLTAVVSWEIVQEYEDTLRDMILKTKGRGFRFSFLSFLEHTTIIQPVTSVSVCRDPDDDKFINCALDGNCSHILSGDNDLLALREYNGIKIITVREFLNIHT